METRSSKRRRLERRNSMYSLNTDCLCLIFSFLNARELLMMEKVCKWFKETAMMTYRSIRVLDYTSFGGPIHLDKYYSTQPQLPEATNIARRVGQYIHTLKLHSLPFCKSGPYIPKFIVFFKNLQTIDLDFYPFFFMDKTFTHDLSMVCREVKVAKIRCLNDRLLLYVLKINQLEALDLSGNVYIEGRFFRELQDIQEINLYNCGRLNPRLFKKFCVANPQLRALHIGRCTSLDRTCIQAVAANLKNLEKLTVSSYYSNITKEDFLELAKLSKITHLEVMVAESFDLDKFLLEITSRNRLEHLSIRQLNCGVLPNVLRNLTGIKKLDISQIYIDDTILTYIPCTETLQELHLALPRVKSITSSGLTYLIQKFKSIRFIDITGCTDVDKSFIPRILPHLKGRSHTLVIVVKDTLISKNECRKMILPNNLRLMWKSGGISRDN